METRFFIYMYDQSVVKLKSYHIAGLGAFGALFNRKFNPVALFQTAKAVRLNGRVMYKDIRAIIPADEAVTFGTIEPFDGSGNPLAHGDVSPF